MVVQFPCYKMPTRTIAISKGSPREKLPKRHTGSSWRHVRNCRASLQDASLCLDSSNPTDDHIVGAFRVLYQPLIFVIYFGCFI